MWWWAPRCWPSVWSGASSARSRRAPRPDAASLGSGQAGADDRRREVPADQRVREQVVAPRAVAQLVEVHPSVLIAGKRQRRLLLDEWLEAQFEGQVGEAG